MARDHGSRNNVLHREGYQEVDRIETPDDRTVVVRLRRRYAPFVTQFFTTLQEGAKPVLPAHLLAAQREINDIPYNALPVGSGPFRFASWDRGQRIVLVANEHYFRGAPRLARIELRVAPNVNTLLTLLHTHEIDMLVGGTPLAYVRFQGVPGFRATLSPWNSQQILALNNARPALRHVEVRQAVARAIDYDALIAKVWYGTARRARDILPPTALGYLDQPPYPYDPATAAAILRRAGWLPAADGIRAKNSLRIDLTMVIAAGGPSQQVGVQIQSMLRRAGIGLTLKPYPYRGNFAFDGPIVRGNYDLALFANTLSYDPDNTARLGCDQFAPRGENGDALLRSRRRRARARRPRDRRSRQANRDLSRRRTARARRGPVRTVADAGPRHRRERRSAWLRAGARRRPLVERLAVVDLTRQPRDDRDLRRGHRSGCDCSRTRPS